MRISLYWPTGVTEHHHRKGAVLLITRLTEGNEMRCVNLHASLCSTPSCQTIARSCCLCVGSTAYLRTHDTVYARLFWSMSDSSGCLNMLLHMPTLTHNLRLVQPKSSHPAMPTGRRHLSARSPIVRSPRPVVLLLSNGYTRA